MQAANLRRSSLSIFGHLGLLGLFLLAIIDSSPLPTFCGPDLLTIVLVSTRPNPWYEYAIAATVGSTIGAWFTYRLAQKAGQAYLERHFSGATMSRLMEEFKQGGTGALIASSAIPLPFPTSLVFAAAGASQYSRCKFLALVLVSRGVRYSTVALLAHFYGRHLAHILLHPGEHWTWFAGLAILVLILAVGGFLLHRRLSFPHRAAPAHF